VTQLLSGMAGRIILLSGPVSSGKTTLANALVERYGFKSLKTRELITILQKTDLEREALQRAGEALDRKTKGRWVADALGRALLDLPNNATVVVDSVRIERQVKAMRQAFGPRVVHVHLTAPTPELARRYRKRPKHLKELASYELVRANPTERSVYKLSAIADVVVDTHLSTSDQVVVRVAARLGLYGRGYERLVDVLVGGQYGSEGKGQIAAYLAPEYDVLVRVGGPNAGHTVYEEPEPFTFHQLPSGTRRNPAAQIVLGAGAVISIERLLDEIGKCELSPERLAIDRQAMIIEPADRLSEKRLVKKIGSTGQGVGAATVRKILRTSASPPVRLAQDEPALKSYLQDTRVLLEDAFARGKHVLLEGTQGTGLSLHHGRYPHVTSRDTSVSGCLAEAGIAPSRVRRILLVCRTYPIRVESPADGDSGPMTKEISFKIVSERSGIPLKELRKTERTSTTKRKRRVAEFDWSLFRQAASLNGPTDIVLTFADYLTIANRSARRFEQLDADTIRFIEELERVAAAPVSLIATRFNFRSIIDRRNW
jgi:adenylosuccinate synthase